MATQVGRLALRVEGDYWNAYYALPDTMEDSIHLGSIRMCFVGGHKKRKKFFMRLMQEACADIIEEATGERPTWNEPTPGPEHERSGNA